MNDWAAEWAAWNVGVERSRYEYDKTYNGSTYDARAWPLAQVRAFYDYAIAGRGLKRWIPPHKEAPHRCDRKACADWNRQWWAAYARERRAARKAS